MPSDKKVLGHLLSHKETIAFLIFSNNFKLTRLHQHHKDTIVLMGVSSRGSLYVHVVFV